MDLWNTISALFGGGSKPLSVPFTPASQPTHYPTDEDAEFAKKYDYSYGQPWAPEFEGKSARLLAGSPNESPIPVTTISPDRPGLSPVALKALTEGPIKNYYAKAALAVQNSALASLGFDPSKAVADLSRDPHTVNIAGFFKPRTDELYANAQDPSTIVHESIHRGIDKLSKSPF